MISENTQVALVGLGSLLGGVFVLIRRKSLAKANAKNMVGRFAWTRLDYSEEYFLFHGTACGIFFILVGILCLLAAIFRDENRIVAGPVGYLITGIVVFIFLAGLLVIGYGNYRFRSKK